MNTPADWVRVFLFRMGKRKNNPPDEVELTGRPVEIGNSIYFCFRFLRLFLLEYQPAYKRGRDGMAQ